MSKHTREKKLKQKCKQAEQAEAENIKLDVLRLIGIENTSTKPNMGKFLKRYVKCIKAIPDGMIRFYPVFEYRIQRVFLCFLDGHELMFCPNESDPEKRYICSYRFEDIKLKRSDLQAIDDFFKRLVEFKFICISSSLSTSIISIYGDRRRDCEVSGGED